MAWPVVCENCDTIHFCLSVQLWCVLQLLIQGLLCATSCCEQFSAAVNSIAMWRTRIMHFCRWVLAASQYIAPDVPVIALPSTTAELYAATSISRTCQTCASATACQCELTLPQQMLLNSASLCSTVEMDVEKATAAYLCMLSVRAEPVSSSCPGLPCAPVPFHGLTPSSSMSNLLTVGSLSSDEATSEARVLRWPEDRNHSG